MSTQDEVFGAETSAFEPLYAGRAPVEGLGMRFDFAPWDIGEAQRSVIGLERSGGFTDPVLDAGCGRGANSIYLAGCGHQVTGVDISPSAVAHADEQARSVGAEVQFVVGDATRLEDIAGGFATVLDYGLYHCLNGEQRRRYAAALHRVCEPGAKLHLFSFSETAPPGLPPAWLRVSQDDLRTNLDGHWRVLGIEETSSATRFTREFLERQRADAPAGGLEFDPDMLGEDERGRLLLPMWHVHAERV